MIKTGVVLRFTYHVCRSCDCVFLVKGALSVDWTEPLHCDVCDEIGGVVVSAKTSLDEMNRRRSWLRTTWRHLCRASNSVAVTVHHHPFSTFCMPTATSAHSIPFSMSVSMFWPKPLLQTDWPFNRPMRASLEIGAYLSSPQLGRSHHTQMTSSRILDCPPRRS